MTRQQIMTKRRDDELTDEQAIQALMTIGETEASARNLLAAQDAFFTEDVIEPPPD